jgi:hypothetical protein
MEYDRGPGPVMKSVLPSQNGGINLPSYRSQPQSNNDSLAMAQSPATVTYPNPS